MYMCPYQWLFIPLISGRYTCTHVRVFMYCVLYVQWCTFKLYVSISCSGYSYHRYIHVGIHVRVFMYVYSCTCTVCMLKSHCQCTFCIDTF